MSPFSPARRSRMRCMAHWSSPNFFRRGPIDVHDHAAPGRRMQRGHGRHAASADRSHEQVGAVPVPHLAPPLSVRADPVTALLHAGIINAGGFLINRLAPLFGLSRRRCVAFFIGTLTAVLGASMMLAQNDIKNMLGFSTIGQMGYMVMECGLGAFALAVFHLIARPLQGDRVPQLGNVIGKARLEPHFPRS